MNVVIVFVLLAIILFVSAYIANRRFGILGLALAAGSILSTIWSYDAGLVVSTIGLFPYGPITNAVTLALIIILPAILLLFHGAHYKNIIGRIGGATIFTLLALAFMVEPLGQALVLQGTGADIYNWLADNKELIISVGIVVAIVDLFFTKPVNLFEKRRKR